MLHRICMSEVTPKSSKENSWQNFARKLQSTSLQTITQVWNSLNTCKVQAKGGRHPKNNSLRPKNKSSAIISKLSPHTSEKRIYMCIMKTLNSINSIIYQGTQIIIYHSFSLCGRNVCILCVLVRPESERNTTAYVFCQFLAYVGQSALDNKSICLPKK